MQYSQQQIDPSSTPKSISTLLMVIAISSALIAILNSLYFGNPGLEAVFGLSISGIKQSYFWQLFSYPFILESGGEGLSSSFIFSLAINIYILWLLCTVIFDHIGSRKFFLFSFLCTLGAGVAGIIGSELFQHKPLLMGQSPLILGLLTLWTVLNPEAILVLFFVFPVKIKWLTLATLIIACLNSITHFDFASLFFYLAGPIVAYFFGISLLKKPFERLKEHFNYLLGRKPMKNDKIIHVNFR